MTHDKKAMCDCKQDVPTYAAGDPKKFLFIFVLLNGVFIFSFTKKYLIILF